MADMTQTTGWDFRRQMCERDVREAKFVITGNVAALLFAKEFYGLQPSTLVHGTPAWAIVSVLILGGALGAVVLILAYARERAILALLAGDDVAHFAAGTRIIATSPVISLATTGAFLASIVALAIGVLKIVLYVPGAGA